MIIFFFTDLQRILVRSESAILIEVKRVTQTNKGNKATAIDGAVFIFYKGTVENCNFNGNTAFSGCAVYFEDSQPGSRVYLSNFNGNIFVSYIFFNDF